MKEIEPKRSAASWLAELAKGRYGEYALSVLTALLGVACSLVPYFIIIRLITALVNGTAELTYCLTLCAWMAGFWVLRYVLHSVSTSLSHHATFHVLANTRTRLLDKLATLPLGTVLDRSSGSYKNIVVERVDSIHVHDSVYIHQWAAGDTQWVEKVTVHTRYRDRWLADTIIVHRRDSVPYPVEVTKEVVKYQLRWWQKPLVWLGGLSLLGLSVWWLVRARKWE